jgi:hypothetical protein
MVDAMAFSFDGELLVTTSVFDSIRVLDRTNNAFRCLMTFRCHGAKTLALSRSGQRLAILQINHSIEVLNIPSGESLFTLWRRGHCHSLTLSPDGKFLAVSWADVVELHDVATATLVGSFSSGRDSANAVAFSPDGRFFATASCHGLRVWDVCDAKLYRKLDRQSRAWHIALSPNNHWVVEAGYSSLELWHLPSASCVKVLWTSHMNRLDFFSDDHHLVTDRGVLAIDINENGSEPRANAVTHLYIRDQWVNLASVDILWLPPAYRPPCTSMHGNIITWGDAYGNVDYLELDLSKIPRDSDLQRANRLLRKLMWKKSIGHVAIWTMLLPRMRICEKLLAFKTWLGELSDSCKSLVAPAPVLAVLYALVPPLFRRPLLEPTGPALQLWHTLTRSLVYAGMPWRELIIPSSALVRQRRSRSISGEPFVAKH